MLPPALPPLFEGVLLPVTVPETLAVVLVVRVLPPPTPPVILGLLLPVAVPDWSAAVLVFGVLPPPPPRTWFWARFCWRWCTTRGRPCSRSRCTLLRSPCPFLSRCFNPWRCRTGRRWCLSSMCARSPHQTLLLGALLREAVLDTSAVKLVVWVLSPLPSPPSVWANYYLYRCSTHWRWCRLSGMFTPTPPTAFCVFSGPWRCPTCRLSRFPDARRRGLP